MKALRSIFPPRFRVAPYGHFCSAAIFGCPKNDLDRALADFTHALRIAAASLGEGADSHVVWGVAGVAEIIRLRGDTLLAGRIFAAVAVADSLCSLPSSKARPNDVADFKRIMARVPEYRQVPHFEPRWQEGGALTLDEAMTSAFAWSAKQSERASIPSGIG